MLLTDAPRKIQEEAKDIFNEMHEKLYSIGIKNKIIYEFEWDVVGESFELFFRFDLEQFILSSVGERKEDINRRGQKIKSYLDFVAKSNNAKGIKTLVDYDTFKKELNLHFTLDQSGTLDNEEDNWIKIFQERGWTKEIEEIKFKKIFDEENGTKMIQMKIQELNCELDDNKWKMERYIERKIAEIIEDSQGKMDVLKEKALKKK